MEQINQLLSFTQHQGPVTSLEMLYRVLTATYNRISEIVPQSVLLVNGSAAYFHHYQQHIDSATVMNDIDITLINQKETIRELFGAACLLTNAKMVRDTCAVIPMGVVDLHLDIDYRRQITHFRSGVSSPKLPLQVRFESKPLLNAFYRGMNRPKDQEKLRIMALHTRTT